MKVTLLSLLASMLLSSTTINKPVYCEFSDEKEVIAQKTLYDYSGNQFKLYELKEGYAIYAINDDKEIFLEGSYKNNSPYYVYLDKKMFYYLGPGNYHYFDNGKIFNIEDGKEINYETSSNSEYVPNNMNSDKSSNISLMTSEDPIDIDEENTEVDINNYIVIKDHNYFRKLTKIPTNYFGSCGLVGISMLLGYHDTMHNTGFIPYMTYEGDYYKYVAPNHVLDYTSTETLIENAQINKITSGEYPMENWIDMPGTTQAMHDYLFDNYMHTVLGIGNEDGYPMAGLEIKNTVRDYMEENCNHLLDDITVHYGALTYTHRTPKELISRGIPTLLSLTDYIYNGSNTGKWHVVMAYGYKDDKFLTHFGWNGAYQEVILSDATIHSYYTIEYNGSHVHSSNSFFNVSGENIFVCGCGHVFWPTC